MTRIAILHPGQMGATVGRALVEAGHDVGWLPEGRGAGTRRRAEEAGLTALDDVADRDLVVSVCPPAAAVDTARSVAGFSGLYLDANAVSPGTASEVAAVVAGSYVDGGIVGPPPVRAGSTRLFLSGSRAGEVAAVFAGSRLEPVVLDGDTAASALKMTYAAWTKGTAALLVAIRATAQGHGVDDELLAEWAISQPGLADRYERAVQATGEKGWRWVAEMREIAATFAASGQPDGFHLAAAEVFDAATAGR